MAKGVVTAARETGLRARAGPGMGRLAGLRQATMGLSLTCRWPKAQADPCGWTRADEVGLPLSRGRVRARTGALERNRIHEFNKIIVNLKNVDVKIEKEDQGIIILSSLSKSYEHIVNTLLYGKQTLIMTEVKSVLMSKQLQRRTEDKEENIRNILIAGGRSEFRENKFNKKCFYCHKEGHFKRNCPDLLNRQGAGLKENANLTVATYLGDG
ncbi:hypothetical protein M5K25_002846 [Dendrobium thyrsiflorum]|uniref:CCHC-type domain-containing protein n=1 Tax=Dendrobium thyrsiflorum TaxID=117978 RepID=A0ABD0VV25_DENTH